MITTHGSILKIKYIMVLLLVYCSLFAQRQFIQLNKDVDLPFRFRIIEQDSNHTRIEIRLAGYYGETVRYQEKEGVVITVPDMSPIENGGAPDLPQLNRIIQVPDKAMVEFSIVSSAQRTIPDITIAPSKGFITYNQNENLILRKEGEIYKEDKPFPETLFGINVINIMRDVRILSFYCNPFQYDPVTKVLTITSSIVVDFLYKNNAVVNYASAQNVIADQNPHPSVCFENMYKSLLVNYNPAILSGDNQAYSEASNPAGEKMLILIADKYYTGNQSIIENYMTHKQNAQGITCLLSAVSPGSTKEDVLSVINAKYASDAISYVLLVGDIEDIPSNTGIVWQYIQIPPSSNYYPYQIISCSDQWYSLLAGSDYYPEVLVSRISVDNVTDLQKQLNKIISYDNSTDGENWQKHSFISYEDINPVVSDIGNVAGNGMTYHTQFNTVTKISNHETNYATTLQNAFNLNDGIGVLVYFGHGDYNGLYSKAINNDNTLIFGPNDILALNNNHFPLMYSVACYIGNFKENDCFSEWLMNAGSVDNPRGTAAIFSSTEVMGIGDPEPALVAAFTDKYYNRSFKSFGDFCTMTKLIALSKLPERVYYHSPINGETLMAFAQLLLYNEWNILGDCSTPMKLGSPLAENHNLQNVAITNSVGPIIFTANKNIQMNNVSVTSKVRTATIDKIKNTVPCDLDVRSGNQIRVTPGFTAGNGTEVRIAIDPALKN